MKMPFLHVKGYIYVLNVLIESSAHYNLYHFAYIHKHQLLIEK